YRCRPLKTPIYYKSISAAVRNRILHARKRLTPAAPAPRWREMEPTAVNSQPVLAQLEMLVNLHPRPHLAVVMVESNQTVQTRGYYASDQQIPQVAAIYRDHEKISVRALCRCG